MYLIALVDKYKFNCVSLCHDATFLSSSNWPKTYHLFLLKLYQFI